jgi:hypothetical protein
MDDHRSAIGYVHIETLPKLVVKNAGQLVYIKIYRMIVDDEASYLLTYSTFR